MRARLLERLGRRLGFSPVGRPVRVWVEGWPGEEDSKVADATVVAVAEGEAVIEFDEPARLRGRDVRSARVAPRETGFGLDALWFSFIAVDAVDPESGGHLGRWAIRLGSRP